MNSQTTPFHSHGLELDMPLDVGIAEAVHILRESGIETSESCEGGPGHVFAEPTIRFDGPPCEGYKAVAIALERGLPIYAIRRVWIVVDGELTGPVWEIVLKPAQDSSSV
jgi:hypothetical protein